MPPHVGVVKYRDVRGKKLESHGVSTVSEAIMTPGRAISSLRLRGRRYKAIQLAEPVTA